MQLIIVMHATIRDGNAECFASRKCGNPYRFCVIAHMRVSGEARKQKFLGESVKIHIAMCHVLVVCVHTASHDTKDLRFLGESVKIHIAVCHVHARKHQTT